MSARAGKRRRVIRRGLVGLGMILGVVLLGLGVWVAFHWPEVSDMQTLPSAYEAKEMCSCLFVEKQSRELCERFVGQDILPIDGRSVDTTNRSVTVRALWSASRARHVSDRLGCVLDPPE